MAKKKKVEKNSLDRDKCTRFLDRNGFEYKCTWSDDKGAWHMTPAQADDHSGYYIHDDHIDLFVKEILQVT